MANENTLAYWIVEDGDNYKIIAGMANGKLTNVLDNSLNDR
jgi:hypothetical protein